MVSRVDSLAGLQEDLRVVSALTPLSSKLAPHAVLQGPTPDPRLLPSTISAMFSKILASLENLKRDLAKIGRQLSILKQLEIDLADGGQDRADERDELQLTIRKLEDTYQGLGENVGLLSRIVDTVHEAMFEAAVEAGKMTGLLVGLLPPGQALSDRMIAVCNTVLAPPNLVSAPTADLKRLAKEAAALLKTQAANDVGKHQDKAVTQDDTLEAKDNAAVTPKHAVSPTPTPTPSPARKELLGRLAEMQESFTALPVSFSLSKRIDSAIALFRAGMSAEPNGQHITSQAFEDMERPMRAHLTGYYGSMFKSLLYKHEFNTAAERLGFATLASDARPSSPSSFSLVTSMASLYGNSVDFFARPSSHAEETRDEFAPSAPSPWDL